MALHEIRLVGRGGQGIVSAGELLGRAAVAVGGEAQSIPTFGPERRGALTQATLRLSDEPIRRRCSRAEPEVVIVLDPTIWEVAPVFGGVREGVVLVMDAAEPPEALAARLRGRVPVPRYEVWAVDATAIALEHLGRAITNTAMMGAFVGATGLLDMAAVERVLGARFGRAAEANVAAARAAREAVRRAAGEA